MRISKADVYKALDKAAANIKKAAGSDGRASRTEVAKALKGLKGTEKALTDMFFRFIDKRDAKPGAVVTKADWTKAIAYARKELIADYDLNNNGLSDAEVSKMSKTGKLAVALAKEMKAKSGGRVSGGEGGRVSGGEGGRVSGGEGGRVSGGEGGRIIGVPRPGGRVSYGEGGGYSYGGGGYRVGGGE